LLHLFVYDRVMMVSNAGSSSTFAVRVGKQTLGGSSMPSSSNGSERDFTSSNEERQSELTDESGRTGERSASSRIRTPGGSHRGFAAMDQQKQREIASKGGRAAHVKGTAHQWSSDEARAAGRKGGEAVSQNREHMSAIGRRGGEARGQRASGANGNGTDRSFE
jgi:hypothetical protein